MGCFGHEEGVSWKEYGPKISLGECTQKCDKNSKRGVVPSD